MSVLAIDLGGTRLRAGLTDGSALPDPVEEGPTPKSRAEFTARIAALLERHGATRLGIGVPGLTLGTQCRWIPNLGFLDGLDVAPLFPGVAIGLGNDAQLALLAEASAGAAMGVGDAILIAIGTGLGSAVLSGSRIVRGSQGGACSFGWAVVDAADPGHPRQGWLERHASGTALDQAARQLGLADGPALIRRARDGDNAAQAALALPMQSLGAALAGAVGLLDPALIVVAGGVAADMDLLAPLIRVGLDRQLPPHLRGIELKAGRFGPQAGLIGAAIAGRQGVGWGEIDG